MGAYSIPRTSPRKLAISAIKPPAFPLKIIFKASFFKFENRESKDVINKVDNEEKCRLHIL
jgi:hypothetical protein